MYFQQPLPFVDPEHAEREKLIERLGGAVRMMSITHLQILCRAGETWAELEVSRQAEQLPWTVQLRPA